ncbi:helix-turn-helix transcriptional regulator [Actinocorallia lasiicapitis]
MGRPANPLDPKASLASHYGWRVRTLREERGWTLAELGKRTAMSLDAVSKLELGKAVPADRTGELLDAVFGTDGYFTSHACFVRKERNFDAARAFYAAEGAAARIHIYEPKLVTGLLQTEGYTRALAASGSFAEEVDQVVEARRGRQDAVFNRAKPPQIVAIFEEAVLRSVLGDAAMFRGQLEWLLEIGRRWYVTIQVIPFGALPAGGVRCTCSLLFDEGGGASVYAEGVSSGLGQFYTDDTVGGIAQAFDRTRAAALSAPDSAALIKEALGSL